MARGDDAAQHFPVICVRGQRGMFELENCVLIVFNVAFILS